MDGKIEYSCKRRKDYVTLAAIIMFSLIVVFELYLILILPIQLGAKNAMKDNVTRQRMTAFADQTRDQVTIHTYIGTKDPLFAGEIQLTQSCLDQLAFYVRANQKNLTAEQVFELQETFMKFANIVDSWKVKKYHIVNRKFNADPILNKIESELKARMNKRKARP